MKKKVSISNRKYLEYRDRISNLGDKGVERDFQIRIVDQAVREDLRLITLEGEKDNINDFLFAMQGEEKEFSFPVSDLAIVYSYLLEAGGQLESSLDRKTRSRAQGLIKKHGEKITKEAREKFQK